MSSSLAIERAVKLVNVWRRVAQVMKSLGLSSSRSESMERQTVCVSETI